MKNERSEISYYPQIQHFIEAQLRSNFKATNQKELYVYWGIGELKANLQRIIATNPKECACVGDFANYVPPLNLDIFALVTDGKKYELLILEVKLVKAAGLNEWSQLVGYCLVSGAKYGLLLNIDNTGSSRLTQLLQSERHISHIHTLVDGMDREHYLGFMQWDSISKCFDYSNLGAVKSISDLSNRLAIEFNE